MYQKTLCVLLGAAGLLMLAACGGSNPPADVAQAPVSGEPAPKRAASSEAVANESQELLEKAFSQAESGRDPRSACTTLAGFIVAHHKDGRLTQGDLDAFGTCYVDVRVRYFEALLKNGASESVCSLIESSLSTWRTALADSVKEYGVDTDALNKRLLEKVSGPVSEGCSEDVLASLMH